jgi:hypothetical protein
MDEDLRVTEFDDISWHDCHIWGIELRPGDIDTGDWTSDLLLHIDFIAEWICDADGSCRFRVAPSQLVFHGVTDLSMSIQMPASGFRSGLHPLSISAIEREPVADQQVYLDRPYYSWCVRLNSPRDGLLAFGAVGFTQTLLAEPQLTSLQHLTPRQRQTLLQRQP